MDQPTKLDAIFGGMVPNSTSRVIASIGDVVLKAVQMQNRVNNWHCHDFDESFLVLDGVFAIEFEGGREVTIGRGEVYTVSAGIKHRGVANDKVRLLRFEKVQGFASLRS